MANSKPAITAKNRRSSARLAAVQALYQMDVAQTDLADVTKEFIAFRLGKEVEGEHMSKADTAFFQDLLAGIVREQRKLDPIIDAHLASKWRLNRIDSTLRAILRAGAYELTSRPDVPHAVVISEYVDVAHAFFEKDEPKVVNGVLQNIWTSHTKKSDIKEDNTEDQGHDDATVVETTDSEITVSETATSEDSVTKETETEATNTEAANPGATETGATETEPTKED